MPPAAPVAKASNEDTPAPIQPAKRGTRRKSTLRENARIVLEGFRGEIDVSGAYRREGTCLTVYCA